MSRLRIAHISDSHFGTIYPGVSEALLKALKELNPDLVVFTGDITQRARISQFRSAKKFVDQLHPLPVLVVPGNHDVPLFNLPARLFWPLRNYKKVFKGPMEEKFLGKNVGVLAFNSTFRFYQIQGRLNLKETEEKLSQLRNQCQVLIVAFHHPLDCAKSVDEKNLLKNRDAVISLFDKYKVDLVMNGHIHDPFAELSIDRYPSIARPMILSLAGTCTSWRIRKNSPNSFNLIEVESTDKGRIEICRYDKNPENVFFEKKRYCFAGSPSGGWKNIDLKSL